MARRKNDFREEDKIKVLLWCARHCCLCGKNAGVGIEVAHLERNRSDIENAIPLCFDCHGAIGHYNVQHPRGRKYSSCELRSRRDQVYEQHTRHLVSPTNYRVTQAAPDGTLLAWYLVLSGSARFLVEFVRINPVVVMGLTQAQLVSLVLAAIGGWTLLARRSWRPAAA